MRTDEEMKENFLRLARNSPEEAADVYALIRKRVQKYADLREDEEAQTVARLAGELDLMPIQVGRLQMIVRQSSKRLRKTLAQYDIDNPAVHPLERVEQKEKKLP